MNQPAPISVESPSAYARPSLSVVIPVYNESQNLSPLYRELQTVLQGLELNYELLFIDDGSEDGSFQVLEKLNQEDRRVKVIQFRRNFGQTSAFAAGFDYARGDLIVTLDADGQNDPADIPRLLEKLSVGDYDLINGWRVERKEPFLRRTISTIANHIITRSTHVVIHDRGCSLKLFKKELVKNLRLYGQLHRFLPELASAIGAKVTEVPVNDRARQHGKSKYGPLSRTPRVLLDLFTIIFLINFFTKPMQFFGSIAFISSLTGFLISAILAITKIYYGITGGWSGFHSYQIGGRPIFLLSILLIILGVQFFMMGILGEMIMRTYYEARDKPPYYVRRVLD